MARDGLFTGVLDLGDIKSYLIFLIFVDVPGNAKNRKG
jgi:hypothetical protein